jgi:tetratricopeptide (TPR) repeat protein/tRNA A-37 threonylcarbamoyl transferase component Bud32
MPSNADRDLLFGLLALQNAFISRDALVGAFGAWVTDRSRALAQILADRGDLAAPLRVALDVLVDAHIARHGGDPAASLATIGSAGSAREALRQVADRAEADFDLRASLAHVGTAVTDDSPAETRGPEPSVDGPPTVRYKRLRPHARGNLGEVFVAHDRELHREVALKEIQEKHADHPGSRTRFLLEAEITGGLEHPGIVPVYGLGAYANGRPFYAMRFIKGDSLADAISKFHSADPGDSGERTVALQKLLRRFLDVCNAIAYAHSRGVLHRDLKPGNIMVGKYGETLVVDWGLAKSLDTSAYTIDGDEAKLVPNSGSILAATVAGIVVGTPSYMSPEQARGEHDRLGPRADVYSLGATLYHLLTGRVPFSGPDLGVVLGKVERGDFPSPRSVAPTVPKPLEAICLKAMANAPELRYRTPLLLAADLEHWLADEPVSALREGPTARVARWARRHKSAALSAFAAVVAVAAIAAGFSLALSRALADRTRALDAERTALAERTRALDEARAAGATAETALTGTRKAKAETDAAFDFLVDAFRRPDPGQDGRQLLVVDLLGGAADRLDAEVAPTARARLLNALGRTYQGLGIYDRAIDLHTKAGDSSEAQLGPDHPDTLTFRNSLAQSYGEAGRVAEAIALHEATLRLREARLGPDHLDTLTSRNDIAVVYLAAGRLAEALPIFESTLRLREAKLGLDHTDTLASRHNLAAVYRDAGRWAEAIALHEATLRLCESKLGVDHPSTLYSRNNLALSYRAAGRVAEAIALHEATLRLREARLGPDHPGTLTSRNNLALAFCDAGRFTEAIALHEATLRLFESKLGPDHPDTLTSRNNLALAYEGAGRVADAIPLHEATLRLSESKRGHDHPATLTIRNNLAAAYNTAGRWAEAIAMHESTLKSCESKLGPDHPDTLTSRNNLAQSYRAAGRLDEAIALHEATLRLSEAKRGADHPNTLSSRNNLASAYTARGRLDEAIALHESTLKSREAKSGPDHPDTLTSRNNLSSAYAAAGRLTEATALREATLKSREAKLGPDHPSTLTSRNNLAQSYRAAGRFDEAIALHESTLRGRESKLGLDHSDTLQSRNNLLNTYLMGRRFANAESLAREVLKRSKGRGKPGDPRIAGDLATLGLCLVSQGKWAEAEPVLRESLAIRDKTTPDAWSTFDAQSMLGETLAGLGRHAEAEPLIVGGYEGLSRRKGAIQPASRSRLVEAGPRVVRLYEAWGKPGMVKAWREKLNPPRELPADPFHR